jgi:spore coat associated protein JA (CotJA)
MNSTSCDCDAKTPGQTVSLAIATVPMQPWEQPYDPQTALKHGTIFPSLDLPFYVTGGDKP